MKKIDSIIKRRIELAENYDKLLAAVESIRPPEKTKGTKHVYQTYAAYVEKAGARDKIISSLQQKNIETQIGTYALHLEPSYKKTKKTGDLNRSQKLYRNLLALPMCHSMSMKDQERVVSEIENCLKNLRAKT
jgi:dTDP-4-amino-4,6-dideoxygalactose transaminase